jgi:hypothetical protein
METMRESWTDERLDDFRSDVNRRFDKVDHELHRIGGRLDTLTKAVVFSNLTLSASVIAGFIAVGS